MGNIISILQEIFMGKEDNVTQVGLSSLRCTTNPVKQPVKKSHTPQELKLSDLMRKGSY
ncbi:hypothetical protein IJ579_04325 [bacterium]|nr:hypothetical protein [bacterium]